MRILLMLALFVDGVALIAVISLLMAWPVKWCWNYAVVTTFGLPALTGGKAWCLSFLAGTFFKSHNFTTTKK